MTCCCFFLVQVSDSWGTRNLFSLSFHWGGSVLELVLLFSLYRIKSPHISIGEVREMRQEWNGCGCRLWAWDRGWEDSWKWPVGRFLTQPPFQESSWNKGTHIGSWWIKTERRRKWSFLNEHNSLSHAWEVLYRPPINNSLQTERCGPHGLPHCLVPCRPGHIRAKLN